MQRSLIPFGKQIRKLREERKLSQEKLSEMCEVHRNYVGRVERAETNIGFERVLKLAYALQVKPMELFRLVPIPETLPKPLKKKKKG
ncbi:MAG TPA: helix-turn-helix transcriptional regulator [Candidatus Angelobacter sp.]|nr:helix-turn-helix transcriptional regulator [Candidatus Angelobacter sp.]